MMVRCPVCGVALKSENWQVPIHQHKFGIGANCYGSIMPILEIGIRPPRRPDASPGPMRLEVGSVVYLRPFWGDHEEFYDGDEDEDDPFN